MNEDGGGKGGRHGGREIGLVRVGGRLGRSSSFSATKNPEGRSPLINHSASHSDQR